MATAIEFENISKQYRLGLVSTKTLSHDLNRWWQTSILGKEDPYLKIGETNDRATKGESEYVWALKDINFKIEQGDVVGIIGKNGAGKSTLLKLLSRVTGPTTGTIRARGRIASLLEVGTGFHPEMTGRENIYLNGAIMGMTKQEIDRKLDEIVDFSGCERYLDTPVKRYSSGMTVRLGFAVAAHLDPEILVVDEVLAVGDAEFQKKAIGKMQDVSRGEGRTVLFVSHNMASIQNLCKNGVLLKNGMVEYSGEINSVIEHYLSSNIEATFDFAEHIVNKTKANAKAFITNVELLDAKGEVTQEVLCGDTVSLNVAYHSELMKPIEINIGVYNSMGDKILHLSSKYTKNDILTTPPQDGVVSFCFDRLPLPEGLYTTNISFWIGGERRDWVGNALQINVGGGDYYGCGAVPSASESKVLTNYSLLLQHV